jgi:hypothetical protein
MSLTKGLLIGLVGLVGLAGCTSPPAAGPSPAPPGRTAQPSRQAGNAPQTARGPVEPKTKAAVRTAATHFYSRLTDGQFAAAWDLLAPAAKQQIPRRIWVNVHLGCQAANEGRAGAVKSVTIFGDAAIVTEKMTSSHSNAHVTRGIFNYVERRWGYSPDDSSIYQGASVAADIAAAKAHGLCSGREDTTL